jgi:NCAIR mutase (PurE)-related protein
LASGRKVEDEREAVRCLRAAQRAGLSAGAWGRAHGVDGRSLHAWQMNIERRRTPVFSRKRAPKLERAAHALVELVPAAAPAPAVAAGRYVMDVNGVRVEFGDDVSVATLRRVLEALRSC